jgi:hypothetical protein
VLEAAAGDATRSDVQEPPHCQGSGARCHVPVQEGQASDEGAAGQGTRLDVDVFDPLSAESATRQAPLVKECLQEAYALAKSKGETLQ